MTERVDVVVVGGGAMGAATAWRLAEHGRSVVLLEKFDRIHHNGSSHGQTRIFRVAYRDPLYTQLATQSIPLWRELEQISGETLLEQTGQVDHGITAAIDEIENSLTSNAYAAERMTPEQAHERWPGMNFDNAVVFSPDGGRVFAEKTVNACIGAAVSKGSVYRDNSPVEKIEIHDDHAIVHTPYGSWEANTVVIATGAWVGELLKDLVALPPLAVTLQQPVHFAIKEGFHFPSYLHHMHSDDSRGFGAYGLESPGEGVKLGLEDTIRAIDISNRSFDIDESVSKAAQDYARRWLPGADPEAMTATTCLFTETVDSHFLIDRAGPIVVCSPCSGHGFKFVPIIGEITAQLAMGVDHGVNAWRLSTTLIE